ncbi:hypothetical protein BRCON_2255 [Candidatus Sumerlaea chitinivorans]|uniref:Uncharacterized protein n=1 Tax=Sumerlaea chitinivorans TaxID=2250252 RepID=A0A2Z4Y8N5_SUMC1|nr:hypothetical protein BRCON_2255 [Candidatus Sumerlaea chitinivorans]
MAIRTFVEELACVGRHDLLARKTAMRARDEGVEKRFGSHFTFSPAEKSAY